MSVAPDFGAVAASGDLSHLLGAALTVALTVAVAVLIVSAIAWVIASTTGSWQGATRARAGVLTALAGAALTGGALAWTNWLLDTGAHL